MDEDKETHMHCNSGCLMMLISDEYGSPGYDRIVHIKNLDTDEVYIMTGAELDGEYEYV